MPEQSLNNELQECIKSCLDCHALCEETVNYCLEKGGRHAEAPHIRLLLDGAEICQAAANFMLRDSDLYMSTCSVCAEVCDSVAESCEQMDGDLKMRVCADQCRNTADLCDRVSQQMIAA